MIYEGRKMIDKIKVSIICNTYNHEKYIKEALDSFLMQKTNFAYEVLIHDDASTDTTASIIREYESKYPNIIKPIYQTKNQYSQNISITDKYQLPRLQGKYVAICEGDDYWTDPFKLQKQFDIMEEHPEIDICAHGAERVKATNRKTIGYVTPSKEQRIFSVSEVIAGGGGFVATNTLFYRRELLENQPEFRKFCQLDYSLQIHGALRGGMMYLPDIMSVYRVMVPGSWTARVGKNKKYNLNQFDRIIQMLTLVDKETNNYYSDIIYEAQLKLKFISFEAAGMFEELRKGKLKVVYDRKPLSWKIKTYIKEYLPFIIKIYHKIK